VSFYKSKYICAVEEQ